MDHGQTRTDRKSRKKVKTRKRQEIRLGRRRKEGEPGNAKARCCYQTLVQPIETRGDDGTGGDGAEKKERDHCAGFLWPKAKTLDERTNPYGERNQIDHARAVGDDQGDVAANSKFLS
jgi:hypothetical protein